MKILIKKKQVKVFQFLSTKKILLKLLPLKLYIFPALTVKLKTHLLRKGFKNQSQWNSFFQIDKSIVIFVRNLT